MKGPLCSLWAIFLLILCSSTAHSVSYLDEIQRAKNTRFERGLIIIDDMEIGRAVLGDNRFEVTVTNKSSTVRQIIVILVANPGLSGRVWETRRVSYIAPGERHDFTGYYKLDSLSPFGKLTVRVLEAGEDHDVLFAESFHIGAENPNNQYDLTRFGVAISSHVNLYFLPNTLAAEQKEEILAEREEGLSRIEQLLGIHIDGVIDIFLYPDMETKQRETLHTGTGWGVNRIIVEVYNNEIQLDPYHEMTHIVTGTVGEPPSMFEEGVAVFVAEKLGADALEYVGTPGENVDAVVRVLKRKGHLIPLTELLADIDIGNTPERSVIEYAQSGSFVKFLFESEGADAIREVLSTLRSGEDPATKKFNLEGLKRITGRSLSELEMEWIGSI